MHKIIRDEEQLRKFIAWLPELQKDEAYFICLQARKKYMPSLKANDKCQLKRFVSTKDRLFDKIKQLECPLGSYLTNEGEVIGDDALVLYITLNPRDMRAATFASIKSLITLIEKNDVRDLNPHSEVLSQIHKCKARSVFVHFDIDAPLSAESDKNANKCGLSLDEIYNKAVAIVGPAAVEIIQTRGGCHVLVHPEHVSGPIKNWHWALRTELNCDQAGDLMMPVVGCCQGNYVPSFYETK